jgi:DNA-binding IclR family transcriptional regulator
LPGASVLQTIFDSGNDGQARQPFAGTCIKMGRVLLAALPPPALDKYIREASNFVPLTLDDPENLLSRLNEVRKQGWSSVRREVEESIIGVSVPLCHPPSQIIAAIQGEHGDRTHIAERRQENHRAVASAGCGTDFQGVVVTPRARQICSV